MKFCSVAALAWLVFVHLGPANWQPRTGLGWQLEHVLGYFVVTSIVCLAWPRPFWLALPSWPPRHCCPHFTLAMPIF